MKSYRVKWEIDIEADSPEEAAARALIIQRDRDEANAATVFTVSSDIMGFGGKVAETEWVQIDLGEMTAEQAEERVRNKMVPTPTEGKQ